MRGNSDHGQPGRTESDGAAALIEAAYGYAREPARLEALRKLELLDTPPEVVFDRIAELVREILDVPIALVSLVDQERQWFKSSLGLASRETGLDRSFCMHAVLSNDIFVVSDAAADPRFASNPAVIGDPFVRFYAGAPIRSRDGHGLGTLCAIDRVAREVGHEDLGLLRTMAETLADVIELRAAALAARREAQRAAHLSLLVDRSMDAIYTTDRQDMVTSLNPAAERLYGYAENQIVGRPRRILVPAERVPEETEIFERVVRGQQIDPYDTTRVRKDGTLIDVSLTMSQLPDLEGRVIGVCVIARDIRERRAAEQNLRLARDEAERANASKTEFLSRMSHELRTPLHAILGFAQLLRLSDLNDEQRESIGQIVEGGRRLLELINEVLDLSRIESGQLRLSLEPVPLLPTVRSCIELIKPLADARGIAISIDSSADEECHVMADRQRLGEVLLNLLSNAIKYNFEGGAILVTVAAGTNETINIAVSDWGPGIAPEDVPKLFLPFERVGAEHSTVEGTGLGLALAKRLAEAMGGDITVDTKREQGASFVVELEAVDAPTMTVATTGEDSKQVRSSHKLLYIEDNPTNRLLMEKIVASQRPGMEVMIATTGKLGLDLARRHKPQVILLDLHLPDLEGEDVVARLRAEPSTAHIPVVILSADATPSRIERLLASGVEHYVTKPINVRILMDVLDHALGDL